MTDAKSDSEEQAVELKRHASAVTDLKIGRAAWAHCEPGRKTVIVCDCRRAYDFLLRDNDGRVSVTVTSGVAARAATRSAIGYAQLLGKRRNHAVWR